MDDLVSLVLGWLRATYHTVWLLDFEYGPTPEGWVIPKCMVAREAFGRLPAMRLSQDQLIRGRSPFNFSGKDLFVSYAATAELSAFIALDWPFPVHVLDLFTEYSVEKCTIGKRQGGRGLLEALEYYGFEPMDSLHKDEMRKLAMRSGPYTLEEMEALLDYCEQDVIALEKLLPVMLPRVLGLVDGIKRGEKKHPGFSQALFRGRYMRALAWIDHNGIPIDVGLLKQISDNREALRLMFVEHASKKYGIFEGSTLKRVKFKELIDRMGACWPKTPKGQYRLDDETLRRMAEANPFFQDLRTAIKSLSELKNIAIVVKSDGYSRPYHNPFGSASGRNQPRKPKKPKGVKSQDWVDDKGRFIFGMSKWFRSLIRAPGPGKALIYLDQSQQEIGIAAAFSDDENMIEAYLSGDFYAKFAVQARVLMDKDFQDLINDRANKEQKHARKLYKRASLATGYGQGAVSLSGDLNITVNDAQDLIDDHKRLYPKFWKWTEYQTEIAPLKGYVITPLGWRMRIIPEDDQDQNEDGSPRSNYRTLLNWPMQSGGSDIMRLFVCMAVEAGYKILCTVHDAMLAECDAKDVDKVAEALVKIMEEASWVVLGGKLTLRTGVKKFVYPDRYIDEDGEETFLKVTGKLNELEKGNKTDACRAVLLPASALKVA